MQIYDMKLNYLRNTILEVIQRRELKWFISPRGEIYTLSPNQIHHDKALEIITSEPKRFERQIQQWRQLHPETPADYADETFDSDVAYDILMGLSIPNPEGQWTQISSSEYPEVPSRINSGSDLGMIKRAANLLKNNNSNQKVLLSVDFHGSHDPFYTYLDVILNSSSIRDLKRNKIEVRPGAYQPAQTGFYYGKPEGD